MKHKVVIFAMALASLGLSSAAFAQFNGRNSSSDEVLNNRRSGDQAQQHYRASDDQRPRQREDDRYSRRDERRDNGYRYDYRDGRQNDRRDQFNARGPEFRHGGYIPREYRQHQYVVTNYRAHSLPPPSRGHQWVQVGADYVLIAIATGLIMQIVLGH